MPLTDDGKKFTLFLHGSTLYQFTRIPFGIKTAGAGFIRALDLAIGHELAEAIACYIDDILIVPKTFGEHIKHLDQSAFENLNFSGNRFPFSSLY